MTTNTNIKPEVSLIEQLTQVREALTAERESLLERVASIDAALAVTPSAKPTKSPQKGTNNIRTPKAGGLKEAVLTAVTGSALTVKEIQTLLSEHSPKSVESVVHSLASGGQLTKDTSSPKKFSLPVQPQSEPKKSNGSAARPQASV